MQVKWIFGGSLHVGQDQEKLDSPKVEELCMGTRNIEVGRIMEVKKTIAKVIEQMPKK